MTDTTTTADEATIAGSTGFVLSIDWEGRDYILRVIDALEDLGVAVTLSAEDAAAFDAMVRRTDDGIAFEPYNLDAGEPTGEDLVFFDTESIDGIHVY